MHDYVRNEIEKLLKQLEQSEATIESYLKEVDRLRIEIVEIKKVIGELRLIP